MTISLHPWTLTDKPALMALCNAVDRTFLSDRLPNPYTEADADCWLGMVAENEGKEGVWRSIRADGNLIGSISVERRNDNGRSIGELGYMILTPWWSKGIGTEAVRQMCGIAPRVGLNAKFRLRCSSATGLPDACWRRTGSGWRKPRPGWL